VEALRWSVLRDGETLFDQPISMSLVDVGEYGEYTVVLTATGPGGGSEERTVTVTPADEGSRSGCSTLRQRGGLALAALMVAGVAARRRRAETPAR
jgi:hypothetical protein